jgi:hypothetical protein
LTVCEFLQNEKAETRCSSIPTPSEI